MKRRRPGLLRRFIILRVRSRLTLSTSSSTRSDFVTENSENTFPALPVRTGENVFVWFSTFPDLAAYENYVAALSRSEQWRGEISTALMRYLEGTPEVLKLSPTARSQLRG